MSLAGKLLKDRSDFEALEESEIGERAVSLRILYVSNSLPNQDIIMTFKEFH